MKILIKSGRIIDPSTGIDVVKDVLIQDDKILDIDKNIKIEQPFEIIDATGKIVAPGLIDMHTHLREPGREDEETVYTGTRSAIAGGFTTICCMPNTNPPVDNQGVVDFIYKQAEAAGTAEVFPIACITKERKGETITEMVELKKAGCVAFSDDGNCIQNAFVMRQALEYSHMLNMPIISHCEDIMLSNKGLINEGYTSTILGLAPNPYISESSIVARDIQLAKFTKAQLHIAHVSCAESVKLIRQAKGEGINVTSETCPHYFTLTEDVMRSFNTNTKVNPPLRTQEDIDAIKEGLKDGTIDVIATDHAPHADFEKELEYSLAPFGMIGLQTALSLSIQALIEEEILDWLLLFDKLSCAPAKILNLQRGKLCKGELANLIIINPEKEWIFREENIYSKSKNTPFLGMKLKGSVDCCIVKGKLIFRNGKFK